MKKLKMTAQSLTFEGGYEKYLDNCRQQNLREGTIGHYKQSYPYMKYKCLIFIYKCDILYMFK